MTDSGNAIALLGNHEYNALCFHANDNNGRPLREHSEKNTHQHIETLSQFKNQESYFASYLDWFKTLPLFYETPQFRVVHACWDNEQINFLRSVLDNNKLNDAIINESVKKDSLIYLAIEETLKGKEVELPNGLSFKDKDKNVRREIRIKWWMNPLTSSYSKLSIPTLDTKQTDIPIDQTKLRSMNYYFREDKPVFFGHYWLQGEPMLDQDNICCLDYSVAEKGYLAAYQFDNEPKLDMSKFKFV